MPFDSIREAIADGQEKTAIQELQRVIPKELENDLILLQSQLQHWEQEYHRQLAPPVADRNRIVYSLLQLVSETQRLQTGGQEAARAKSLSFLERDLSAGFEKLRDLDRSTTVDQFLSWFRDRYPEQFAYLWKAEQTNPHPPEFGRVLGELEVEHFITSCHLQANREQVLRYFIQKQQQQPRFITGWIAYQEYKNRYRGELQDALEQTQKQRGRLLKSGLIGGVIGALGINLLESNIQLVIDKYSGSGWQDEDGDAEDEGQEADD